MEARSRSGGVSHLEIDNDIRASMFDKWLLDNNFTYCGTTDSSSGGKRKYSHKKGIIVAYFRGNIDIHWYIDRSSDNKELDHGFGLIIMVNKVKKYIR